MNGNLYIYIYIYIIWYVFVLFCDHTLAFPKQTMGLPCCAFCTNEKALNKVVYTFVILSIFKPTVQKSLNLK
jgi:hypothetical protein